MVTRLPIHDVLSKLEQALITQNQLILQAPPGAGKTTVVPLELLDAPWLEGKKIIMLEPRRLAARNAAYRMAELLGEKVGARTGYRIRQETKVSASTRIEVVTEGILTHMLQSDPALETVGLLIFDEFHERSIHADLGLALALQTQSLLREDLRIVVMSATLNAQQLQKVMPDAAVVTSEGRSHPLTHHYLDIRSQQPDLKMLPTIAADTVLRALNTEEGSVLVFLPGTKEIREVEKRLHSRIGPACVLAPLYGDLCKAAQQRAIAPAPAGTRKIVLATNIAETSLTIEGVRIVIDSGLERYAEYDAGSGMDRMRTRMITNDSAVQRAGRAGRTQSGVCFRLWHEHKPLVSHARAQILQSDLSSLMLELVQWGADANELSWVNPPPKHASYEAISLLISLNMTNQAGQILPDGRDAIALGVHPRLAHMLLRARREGLGYEAVLLATLLQERTGFDGTDLSAGMEWLDAALRRGDAGQTLRHAVNQLAKRLDCERHGRLRSEMAGILTALAFPERIARRRSMHSTQFHLANGKGAVLNDETLFMHETFIAIAEAGGGKQPLRIFHAAALAEEDLRHWFAPNIVREEQVRWREETKRVEALRTERIGNVILKQSGLDDPAAELISKGMLEGIRSRSLSVLPWEKKSVSLRHRIDFVNAHLPGSFTDMDEGHLLHTLEEWLLPYLGGIRDLKGLQKLDMYAIVSAMLGWEAQQRLDLLAPESLKVPSGSKIRIDYTEVQNPLLAVRLQEVFGWRETPCVLEGRVPLTLHLLSPAHRPVQVTQDLASFWQEGYSDVRKELRGRYKKHDWPEDPHSAVAVSGVKKK